MVLFQILLDGAEPHDAGTLELCPVDAHNLEIAGRGTYCVCDSGHAGGKYRDIFENIENI